MPRKGQQKVRTGCRTCKIRKIKCDEFHPACLKCRSTGRNCDGYEVPPPGSYSWEELLLRSKPVPQSVSSASFANLRGLTFFSRIVAPELNGPLNSSFWTQDVPQAAYSEPAVGHAVLAISSLYESFVVQRSSCTIESTLSNDAIRHYNSAIKCLTTPGPVSIDTVLLTCILFVCAEFLCGNAQAAITHVTHGFSLIDTSVTDSDVLSMLRHLAIFPHFFSHDIPNIPLPYYGDWPKIDGALKSLSYAQESLDSLSCHIVRLVRMADRHRLGMGPELQSFECAMLKQKALEQDLENWRSAFNTLRRNLRPRSKHELCLLLLEMRWLVARIWTSTCISPDEMIFDDHRESFYRIVELASQAKTQRNLAGSARGKFSFTMGFSPLLHFVVLKCRYLKLRLTALTLMWDLSCSRESLWDYATMYAIGTRIIEKEHGIPVLSPEKITEVRGCLSDQQALPRDWQRVRDSALEPDTKLFTDDHGTKIWRTKIRFLVKPGSGPVQAIYDWV
ncbi:uncharacterized protein A1O9_10991 [Exophiala aquamarina CBS 119918]|uniref:Zn(2)-C6 fungal-type domain-containing protein n=1 Tax=Exophiala aquamarina CBS 119918 TaxID=1182545 RepID=A0A072P1D0_9EURO|nr:uncharacterized protein A1O9_10991 [Exophiala aquamarina CBS 119918]KEF53083.1 hypothetical protein A1O9_10991 [Exophiala aquamarina CBS 119918]